MRRWAPAGREDVSVRDLRSLLDAHDAGLIRIEEPFARGGGCRIRSNGLDVFMSGTDRGTQRALFPGATQFALVLNPHRRLWRAFRGADSDPCHAAVIVPKRGIDSLLYIQ